MYCCNSPALVSKAATNWHMLDTWQHYHLLRYFEHRSISHRRSWGYSPEQISTARRWTASASGDMNGACVTMSSRRPMQLGDGVISGLSLRTCPYQKNDRHDFRCREHYLTAATYLSSRAFPSSLLSSTPSLQYDPSTEPVLIPGVDALNHTRAQPVSWVVNYSTSSSPSSESGPTIALVVHTPTKAGQALNNNYGPKPNAELILGYGFSLPNNPDDTTVLKLGGAGGGRKFEVGRGSKGVEAVWEEILTQIRQGATKSLGVDEVAEEQFQEYDDLLDAALMFKDMLRTLQKRLPSDSILDETPGHVRPEVASMFHHYVEGISRTRHVTEPE